ncbi:hypothetical protein PPS11_12276 [Pseudomonas putida S11]|nr:hypothetical protein PPS11_12276 [Pseudomonas putida S11]
MIREPDAENLAAHFTAGIRQPHCQAHQPVAADSGHEGVEEVGVGLAGRSRQHLVQVGPLGQAQQVTEAPGNEQCTEQIGDGHQQPVARHGAWADTPGEHRQRQAHHVAGEQFATGQDHQDQADGKYRGAQQCAERGPLYRDHGADVDSQEKP